MSPLRRKLCKKGKEKAGAEMLKNDLKMEVKKVS
jgi:hypothetical protein